MKEKDGMKKNKIKNVDETPRLRDCELDDIIWRIEIRTKANSSETKPKTKTSKSTKNDIIANLKELRSLRS